MNGDSTSKGLVASEDEDDKANAVLETFAGVDAPSSVMCAHSVQQQQQHIRLQGHHHLTSGKHGEEQHVHTDEAPSNALVDPMIVEGNADICATAGAGAQSLHVTPSSSSAPRRLRRVFEESVAEGHHTYRTREVCFTAPGAPVITTLTTTDGTVTGAGSSSNNTVDTATATTNITTTAGGILGNVLNSSQQQQRSAPGRTLENWLRPPQQQLQQRQAQPQSKQLATTASSDIGRHADAHVHLNTHVLRQSRASRRSQGVPTRETSVMAGEENSGTGSLGGYTASRGVAFGNYSTSVGMHNYGNLYSSNQSISFSPRSANGIVTFSASASGILGSPVQPPTIRTVAPSISAIAVSPTSSMGSGRVPAVAVCGGHGRASSVANAYVAFGSSEAAAALTTAAGAGTAAALNLSMSSNIGQAQAQVQAQQQQPVALVGATAPAFIGGNWGTAPHAQPQPQPQQSPKQILQGLPFTLSMPPSKTSTSMSVTDGCRRNLSPLPQLTASILLHTPPPAPVPVFSPPESPLFLINNTEEAIVAAGVAPLSDSGVGEDLTREAATAASAPSAEPFSATSLFALFGMLERVSRFDEFRDLTERYPGVVLPFLESIKNNIAVSAERYKDPSIYDMFHRLTYLLQTKDSSRSGGAELYNDPANSWPLNSLYLVCCFCVTAHLHGYARLYEAIQKTGGLMSVGKGMFAALAVAMAPTLEDLPRATAQMYEAAFIVGVNLGQPRSELSFPKMDIKNRQFALLLVNIPIFTLKQLVAHVNQGRGTEDVIVSGQGLQPRCSSPQSNDARCNSAGEDEGHNSEVGAASSSKHWPVEPHSEIELSRVISSRSAIVCGHPLDLQRLDMVLTRFADFNGVKIHKDYLPATMPENSTYYNKTLVPSLISMWDTYGIHFDPTDLHLRVYSPVDGEPWGMHATEATAATTAARSEWLVHTFTRKVAEAAVYRNHDLTYSLHHIRDGDTLLDFSTYSLSVGPLIAWTNKKISVFSAPSDRRETSVLPPPRRSPQDSSVLSTLNKLAVVNWAVHEVLIHQFRTHAAPTASLPSSLSPTTMPVIELSTTFEELGLLCLVNGEAPMRASTTATTKMDNHEFHRAGAASSAEGFGGSNASTRGTVATGVAGTAGRSFGEYFGASGGFDGGCGPSMSSYPVRSGSTSGSAILMLSNAGSATNNTSVTNNPASNPNANSSSNIQNMGNTHSSCVGGVHHASPATAIAAIAYLSSVTSPLSDVQKVHSASVASSSLGVGSAVTSASTSVAAAAAAERRGPHNSLEELAAEEMSIDDSLSTTSRGSAAKEAEDAQVEEGKGQDGEEATASTRRQDTSDPLGAAAPMRVTELPGFLPCSGSNEIGLASSAVTPPALVKFTTPPSPRVQQTIVPASPAKDGDEGDDKADTQELSTSQPGLWRGMAVDGEEEEDYQPTRSQLQQHRRSDDPAWPLPPQGPQTHAFTHSHPHSSHPPPQPSRSSVSNPSNSSIKNNRSGDTSTNFSKGGPDMLEATSSPERLLPLVPSTGALLSVMDSRTSSMSGLPGCVGRDRSSYRGSPAPLAGRRFHGQAEASSADRSHGAGVAGSSVISTSVTGRDQLNASPLTTSTRPGGKDDDDDTRHERDGARTPAVPLRGPYRNFETTYFSDDYVVQRNPHFSGIINVYQVSPLIRYYEMQFGCVLCDGAVNFAELLLEHTGIKFPPYLLLMCPSVFALLELWDGYEFVALWCQSDAY